MNKPLYLKTNDMAKLIGYSGDYLLKNREVLFFKGVHFFPKEKRIDWKVDKMIEWVEGNSISDKAKDILDLVS
ncbi:MAG: hypothetical protein FAF03_09945 [Epsilonproteobacteria bacterium]|nr:hypothetical protein [Campylobacterota bacterium]